MNEPQMVNHKATGLKAADAHPLGEAPGSACCHAPMRVAGKGETHWYECSKCGNACDPYSATGTDPWTGQAGDGFADTRSPPNAPSQAHGPVGQGKP